MRTGLFGGTFNPIHNGHLKAAKAVKKHFMLDRISFIPSFLPPHKKPGNIADASDRMAMIRLAVSGDSDFFISDVEHQRPGPSYTIDTVRHYRKALARDDRLYLIVGVDAFLEMDTWKSYMELFKLIPFIVMARPAPVHEDLSSMWEALENYIKTKISPRYSFSPAQSGYVHPENQPVFIFDFEPLPISSTNIRRRVANGNSISHLVPQQVADYIQTQGLYQ